MPTPTCAVRIHGKGDLRLERFDLPEVGEDEILAAVVANSICMSCHKAARLGSDYRRVPADVASRPTVLGHEFAGTILKAGARWSNIWREGDRFAVQPATGLGSDPEVLGYAFPTAGGNAQQILFPARAVQAGCLLPHRAESFFAAALAEPVSCVIRACRAQYHTDPATGEHRIGIRPGGNALLLGGAGSMGLATADYLLHGPAQPSRLVIGDMDAAKLERARRRFAGENETEVTFLPIRSGDTMANGPRQGALAPSPQPGRLSTRDADYVPESLGTFDDVFVFAPSSSLTEQGAALLADDGCLNFFAGPLDPGLRANLNLYDLHYASHHFVGTSGSHRRDMAEALDLMAKGAIDPAAMITHVGGLDAAAATTLALPQIPGGKKLVYTQVAMPMTPIDRFAEDAECASEPHTELFFRLAEIVERHGGLWSAEAEQAILSCPAIRLES